MRIWSLSTGSRTSRSVCANRDKCAAAMLVTRGVVQALRAGRRSGLLSAAPASNLYDNFFRILMRGVEDVQQRGT